MKPTISDIAKAAGVSTATVSRYINASGYVGKKTSLHLKNIIESMDYSPSAAAVSLSKKTSKIIGVMVPEISNPFFGKVIEGISAEAEKRGYTVMLFDTDESIKKESMALKVLKQQTICGLLLTPVCDDIKKNPDFFKALEKMDVPIVLMDREVKDTPYSGVFYDNYEGMKKLTQHFIKQGHHKIGLIAGDQTLKLSRDRTKGYQSAVSNPLIAYGDFNREKAKQTTIQLIQEESPTALISSNNVMTEGMIQGLYELDMLHSITIGSFDEIHWAKFIGMSIHHLERNPKEMGIHAVNLLTEANKKKNYLKTKLI